mmetsp:Transcript_8495/g.16930  ORF Transcript_8495/g.16930 Transcript_8495/m.16930 type:complete len:460 (-) Transcript_8495:143-1522(-)
MITVIRSLCVKTQLLHLSVQHRAAFGDVASNILTHLVHNALHLEVLLTNLLQICSPVISHQQRCHERAEQQIKNLQPAPTGVLSHVPFSEVLKGVSVKFACLVSEHPLLQLWVSKQSPDRGLVAAERDDRDVKRREACSSSTWHANDARNAVPQGLHEAMLVDECDDLIDCLHHALHKRLLCHTLHEKVPSVCCTTHFPQQSLEVKHQLLACPGLRCRSVRNNQAHCIDSNQHHNRDQLSQHPLAVDRNDTRYTGVTNQELDLGHDPRSDYHRIHVPFLANIVEFVDLDCSSALLAHLRVELLNLRGSLLLMVIKQIGRQMSCLALAPHEQGATWRTVFLTHFPDLLQRVVELVGLEKETRRLQCTINLKSESSAATACNGSQCDARDLVLDVAISFAADPRRFTANVLMKIRTRSFTRTTQSGLSGRKSQGRMDLFASVSRNSCTETTGRKCWRTVLL